MSKRLTSEWVSDISVSHGKFGEKGKEGENFLLLSFKNHGYETKYYPEDHDKQLSGIDMSYYKNNKWWDIDVKNNMNKYGMFFVYGDWLERSKAHFIYHINIEKNNIVFYQTSKMKSLWKSIGCPEYMKFPKKNYPNFIKKFKN